MSTARLDEFLRHLFWYFVLVRAGGKKSLPPQFLEQKTPKFLVDLYVRRGEVIDLSAPGTRVDAAAAGQSAYFTGTELWLRPEFDPAVRDIFYETKPGPFVVQINKVFDRIECPSIIGKWERGGEVMLDSEGILPAAVLQGRVDARDTHTVREIFFLDATPRLPWRGLFVSAWSEGSVVIRRGNRETIERIGLMTNPDRWNVLTAGSPILSLVVSSTQNAKDARSLLYDSLPADGALKQLVERAEPLSPAKFEMYFEPLFADLRQIHEDYLQMFEETRAQLKAFSSAHSEWLELSKAERPIDFEQAPDETPESVAFMVMKASLGLGSRRDAVAPAALRALRPISDELRLRRTTLEPLRVQLQHVLLLLVQRELPPEEQAFIEAVVAYFPLGAVRLQMEKIREIRLHDPWATDQMTSGVRMLRQLDEMIAVLNRPIAAARHEPVSTVIDFTQPFRGSESAEPTHFMAQERDIVAPTIRIADLPRSWTALEKHVTDVLAYHRQQWRVVCAAYEELRRNALSGS